MSAQRSIVICGGAFAGLALALALRQGLGPTFPSSWPIRRWRMRPSRDPPRHRHRRRLPQAVRGARRLGRGRANAQPILDMVVTDSKLEDATRPVFLTFAGDVEPGEPFAHMVENRHLIDALVARAEAAGRRAARHRGDQFRFPRRRRRCHAGGWQRRSRRAFWSPPTARAPSCASAPGSPPMAGTTINPASSSPSAMSATITAAPKSIFCPPARSRSCR